MTGPREENAFSAIAQHLPLISRDLGLIRKVLVETAEAKAKAREKALDLDEVVAWRKAQADNLQSRPQSRPKPKDRVELRLELTVEQWSVLFMSAKHRLEEFTRSLPYGSTRTEAEQGAVRILTQVEAILGEALEKSGIGSEV